MGLDITAYSKIKFDSPIILNEDSEDFDDIIDDSIFLYTQECFELQNEGIGQGYYNHEGEEKRFSAGAYSSYNSWRKELAKLVGTTDQEIWNNIEKYKNTPFFELINFSDAEGFIGPKTSAKLYKDFLDHDEKAAIYSKQIGESLPHWSFKAKYDNWKEAFKLASDGGAVCFH